MIVITTAILIFALVGAADFLNLSLFAGQGHVHGLSREYGLGLFGQRESIPIRRRIN